MDADALRAEPLAWVAGDRRGHDPLATDIKRRAERGEDELLRQWKRERRAQR